LQKQSASERKTFYFVRDIERRIVEAGLQTTNNTLKVWQEDFPSKYLNLLIHSWIYNAYYE